MDDRTGLWARLEHGLRRDPARPALGFRPSRSAAFEWLSHGGLADRCQALATGLRRAFGPPPPGAVLAILKRRDSWWYSYDFAAAAADLISVGLDAGSTDDVLVGVRPPFLPPPPPSPSSPFPPSSRRCVPCVRVGSVLLRGTSEMH